MSKGKRGRRGPRPDMKIYDEAQANNWGAPEGFELSEEAAARLRERVDQLVGGMISAGRREQLAVLHGVSAQSLGCAEAGVLVAILEGDENGAREVLNGFSKAEKTELILAIDKMREMMTDRFGNVLPGGPDLEPPL
jgi:hypothetical protein